MDDEVQETMGDVGGSGGLNDEMYDAQWLTLLQSPELTALSKAA